MKEGQMTTISSTTSSSAAYYANQKNLFSKLDTDQNGTLSQEEAVAARPKGTSESQAAALYAKIDTNGTGALTEAQFQEGMEASRPTRSALDTMAGDAMSVLMLMSQQGGAFGGSSAADRYAEMDGDGDGSVTGAEFIAARPDDVSEEDAQALYDTIDTEGTGAITEEQFAAAMPVPGRPGGSGSPPAGGAGGGGAGGSDSTESASEVFDSLDTNQDGVVSSDEFLAAFSDGLMNALQSNDSDNLDEILKLFDTESETESA